MDPPYTPPLRRAAHTIEPVLEAGLSRNVLLVSILALTLHALLGRVVVVTDTEQSSTERGWNIAMSVLASVIAVAGIQLQISRYAHVANGPPPLDWLLFAYGLMAALVATLGIAYPVLFV